MITNSKLNQQGVMISKKNVHTNEHPPVKYCAQHLTVAIDSLLHRFNQPQPGVVIDIHKDEYTPVSHWVCFGATRDGMSGPRPQANQDDIYAVTEEKSDD